MGSGGKFNGDRIPAPFVVDIFASVGNLEDSVRKIDGYARKLKDTPDDSGIWEALTQEHGRLLTRAKTLAHSIANLLKSQNRG